MELRTHSDYVELFGERGVMFEPGSRWEYSNYGFILLGAVIEAVTGESYYDYVAEHVYQPAGMTSTDSLPEAEDVPDRAVAYGRPFGRPATGNRSPTPSRIAAPPPVAATRRSATCCASPKRCRPGRCSHPSCSPRRPARRARSSTASASTSAPTRRRVWGHGGGAPGMNGDLRVFPELGYVVVVLANLDPPAAQVLADFFTLRMPVETAAEQPSATTEQARERDSRGRRAVVTRDARLRVVQVAGG